MSDALRRASAFEETLREQCADRILPLPWGRAVFNRALNRVWELNVVRVERGGIAINDLVAEADRLQGGAGLAHRRIVVLDEEAGAALTPGFEERGWKTDCFVYMVHGSEPPVGPKTVRVEEVEREAVDPLRETIIRAEPWGDDDEVVRQLLRSSELVAKAGRGRQFAVLVDGKPVSAADLYSDGRTAQIEDVATVPDYRGRGLATAVVLQALNEAARAGHEFVFLIADDTDWPKELYAKLGFEPVGRKFAFLRPPARDSPPRTEQEDRGP
jgi:predicted GNAT family acetyltransferase